jgi:hypothetical protein
MIDPEDLPLDEMSLAPKAPAPASPSWQDDLWTYMQEVPPAFHTGGDYQAAVRLVGLHYPKLKDSLKDWSLN